MVTPVNEYDILAGLVAKWQLPVHAMTEVSVLYMYEYIKITFNTWMTQVI